MSQRNEGRGLGDPKECEVGHSRHRCLETKNEWRKGSTKQRAQKLAWSFLDLILNIVRIYFDNLTAWTPGR